VRFWPLKIIWANFLAKILGRPGLTRSVNIIDKNTSKHFQVNNAGGGTMAGYQDCNFDKPLAVFDYVMNLNCRRYN
jgi:hypothetical protein